MPNLPHADYMHGTFESLVGQGCGYKKCGEPPTIIFMYQLAKEKGFKARLVSVCTPEHRLKLFQILEKHYKMRYRGGNWG